jgi:hypothetical protein
MPDKGRASMRDGTLYRLSGLSLRISGLCTALFWILALAVGSFVGADATRHPLWVPGQLMHVAGALFAIFGLLGLYAAERRRAGQLGLVGFVLAVLGTALFFGDGLIALIVFPAVADRAPELLAPEGALNQGSVLAAFIVIAATTMIGYVVFGVATLRAGVFPRRAVILWITGAVLFNLPPGPIPMLVLATGGVLWGISAIWLGGMLIKGVAAPRATARL